MHVTARNQHAISTQSARNQTSIFNTCASCASCLEYLVFCRYLRVVCIPLVRLPRGQLVQRVATPQREPRRLALGALV
jgi:hypothetical protein